MTPVPSAPEFIATYLLSLGFRYQIRDIVLSNPTSKALVTEIYKQYQQMLQNHIEGLTTSIQQQELDLSESSALLNTLQIADTATLRKRLQEEVTENTDLIRSAWTDKQAVVQALQNILTGLNNSDLSQADHLHMIPEIQTTLTTIFKVENRMYGDLGKQLDSIIKPMEFTEDEIRCKSVQQIALLKAQMQIKDENLATLKTAYGQVNQVLQKVTNVLDVLQKTKE